MSDFDLLMQNMSQTTGMLGQRQENANAPAWNIKTETGPEGQSLATIKMPMKDALGIQQKMTYLEQALQAMTQEANRLQAQEQRTRQHPLIAALSTVAGELAQDRRLPPAVSALGRASLSLNPPPDELAARRMDLEGKIGTLGTAGLRTDIAQMNLQSKLNLDQARMNQRNTLEALKAGRLVAGKGGGAMTPEAWAAHMRSYGVTDPATIQDAYETHQAEAAMVLQGREADLARRERGMTFQEKLNERLAEKKGAISLGNRLREIKYAFDNSVSLTKEAFELKLHEQKKAIDEAAAGSKELRVFGTPATNKLTQASQTNQYLDTVEHMLEQPEFAQVQGPLFQYDPKTGEARFNPQAVLPKQFKNIPRTEVESQISHEIPRLLTLLLNGQAGGASILRTDVGKKLVQDMGITGAIRPDQALAIMKIIRDTNNSNVTAIMRSKPRANFRAIKDLLGADDPRNEYFFKKKKDSFGGPVVPFPSPDQGGFGKPTAAAPEEQESETRRRDPQGAWWVFKEGKWQKE